MFCGNAGTQPGNCSAVNAHTARAASGHCPPQPLCWDRAPVPGRRPASRIGAHSTQAHGHPARWVSKCSARYADRSARRNAPQHDQGQRQFLRQVDDGSVRTRRIESARPSGRRDAVKQLAACAGEPVHGAAPGDCRPRYVRMCSINGALRMATMIFSSPPRLRRDREIAPVPVSRHWRQERKF